MTKKHKSYCWAGVLSATGPKPLDAGRPPKRLSARNPDGVNDTWWTHDKHYDKPNAPKYVVRYGEAFYDKTEAENWTTKTPEGIAWAAGTLGHSLLTFEVEID